MFLQAQRSGTRLRKKGKKNCVVFTSQMKIHFPKRLNLALQMITVFAQSSFFHQFVDDACGNILTNREMMNRSQLHHQSHTPHTSPPNFEFNFCCHSFLNFVYVLLRLEKQCKICDRKS